ncbi:MAG: hypothetical protein ACREVS_04530 [Burkholderiales bacterium]
MSEQEDSALRRDVDEVARMIYTLARSLATAHVRINALAMVLTRKGVLSIDELKRAVKEVEAGVAVDRAFGEDEEEP